MRLKPGRYLSSFDRVVLLTMLISGIGFIIVTPPMQAPDEPAHFLRIWQIASFQPLTFISGANAGAYLPRNLNRFIFHAKGRMPFNPDEKVPDHYLQGLLKYRIGAGNLRFYPFANTATNHFLVYLPQATGVALARLTGRPLLVAFYLGRVFNLIAWSLCVMVAARLYPPVKYLILGLALMPMSIFQASSLSADALVNASIFCFFTLILRICFQPTPIDRKTFLIILCASIPVLIGKPGYFPLVLLILMIPVERFGSIKKKASYTGAWLACFGFMFFLRVRQLLGIEIIRENVSRQDQLHAILSDPIRYTGVLIHSLNVLSKHYCRSFVGYFGWMDTPLADWFVAGYLAFILFISLSSWNAAQTLSTMQKLYAVTLGVGNLILLMTILYTNWTPVGTDIILGFQGRYLVPLAPLFFIIFTNRLIPKLYKESILQICLISVVWASHLYSLSVLMHRYYGIG